jgi:hypothetical protein
MLIKLGIDHNERDEVGQTLLTGSRLTWLFQNGRTALDYAREEQKTEVMTYLKTLPKAPKVPVVVMEAATSLRAPMPTSKSDTAPASKPSAGPPLALPVDTGDLDAFFAMLNLSWETKSAYKEKFIHEDIISEKAILGLDRMLLMSLGVKIGHVVEFERVLVTAKNGQLVGFGELGEVD